MTRSPPANFAETINALAAEEAVNARHSPKKAAEDIEALASALAILAAAGAHGDPIGVNDMLERASQYAFERANAACQKIAKLLLAAVIFAGSAHAEECGPLPTLQSEATLRGETDGEAVQDELSSMLVVTMRRPDGTSWVKLMVFDEGENGHACVVERGRRWG